MFLNQTRQIDGPNAPPPSEDSGSDPPPRDDKGSDEPVEPYAGHDQSMMATGQGVIAVHATYHLGLQTDRLMRTKGQNRSH